MVSPRTATLLGFFAMAFWSTTVGICRDLIDRIGFCSYLAVSSTASGILLFAFEAIRCRDWRSPFRLSPPYALWGGACFVLYFTLFCVAHGLATSNDVAIQLGLVNYLWPACILLFSVFLLHRQARWGSLLAGIALGFCGIAASALKGLQIESLLESMAANRLAFLLMLVAAVAWGLYSNLARRYHDPQAPSGVPLFHLVTGVLWLVVGWVGNRHAAWDAGLAPLLAYATIFPAALGYIFWEIGMRRGDQTLLASCSYGIPLVSTLFSCWYLKVPPGAPLLAGSLLVMAGALLSRRGIVPAREAA